MSQGSGWGDRKCKLHCGGRENPSSKKSQRLKWKSFPLVVLLCWGAGLGIPSSTGLACDSDQNANIFTPLKLHLLSHETKQEGVDLHQLKITYSEYSIIATPKMEKKIYQRWSCARLKKACVPQLLLPLWGLLHDLFKLLSLWRSDEA